jgi:hypothetical protein
MQSFNELLHKADPQSHMVALYGDNDSLLAGRVVEFLREGLERDEAVAVIAAADHTILFSERLEQMGYDPAAITFLDARETLAGFMRGGEPDLDLFDATVGAKVRAMAADAGSAGLRAYGEMVGILWSAREYAAAIRLEHLWNELLNSVVFDLFCAYPIDVFSPDFKAERVDELLCAHTHLVPAGNSGDMQSALNRAMDDVLGSRVVELRPLMGGQDRPAWGEVPKPEAMILWLRQNMPYYADSILERAKGYFEAERTRTV